MHARTNLTVGRSTVLGGGNDSVKRETGFDGSGLTDLLLERRSPSCGAADMGTREGWRPSHA